MREVSGKMIYDSLKELVDPKHTAIIVVDMQNDYCSPGGIFHQNGMDINRVGEVIVPQIKLIEEARRLKVMIIFIQNTTEPGCVDDSPAWLYFKTRERKVRSNDKKRPTVPAEHTVEGTWGHQIISELGRRPQDPIVKKHRSSAFVNTDLDQILRSNGIDSLIVIGAVTQGCVASTARDAQHYDYYVIVVSDCVASFQQPLHEAALKVLASRCDVVMSQDIIREWANIGPRV
ncbi:MAG: cysteine hydrolase family protein [Candidatus Hodarchaeota archaeon]